MMLTRSLFAGSLLAVAMVAGAILLTLGARDVHAADITVHKTPWCGCCTAWVDHLREAGFDVTVETREDLTPIRAELGVPAHLQSCHMAEAEDYAIEGHVPAAEIARLLTERPDAAGLAVPGMPIGSPGMEQGGVTAPYRTVLFGDGGERVWSRH